MDETEIALLAGVPYRFKHDRKTGSLYVEFYPFAVVHDDNGHITAYWRKPDDA